MSEIIKMDYGAMEDMAQTFRDSAQNLEDIMREMESVAASMEGGALLGRGGDMWVAAVRDRLVRVRVSRIFMALWLICATATTNPRAASKDRR
jgi:hypothetical protein